MKIIKYLFIFTLSFQVYAGDIIFENGFEAMDTISGSITGLNSTDLEISLRYDGNVEQLIIDNNGQFSFTEAVDLGSFWQVDITQLPSLPNQQSCVISNNTGTFPDINSSNVIIACNDTAWEWEVMNWNEGGWQ